LDYAVFDVPALEFPLSFDDAEFATDYVSVASALTMQFAALQLPTGYGVNETVSDSGSTVSTTSVLDGTLTTTSSWTTVSERYSTDQASASQLLFARLTKTYLVQLSWSDSLGNGMLVTRTGSSIDYVQRSVSDGGTSVDVSTVTSRTQLDDVTFLLAFSGSHTTADDWLVIEQASIALTASQSFASSRTDVTCTPSAGGPVESTTVLAVTASSSFENDLQAQVTATSAPMATVVTTSWASLVTDEWQVQASSTTNMVGDQVVALTEQIAMDGEGDAEDLLTWTLATDYSNTLLIDSQGGTGVSATIDPMGFTTDPTAWADGVHTVNIELVIANSLITESTSDYDWFYQSSDSLLLPLSDRQRVEFEVNSEMDGEIVTSMLQDLRIEQIGAGFNLDQAWTVDQSAQYLEELLMTSTGLASGATDPVQPDVGREGVTTDVLGWTLQETSQFETVESTQLSDMTTPGVTLSAVSTLEWTSNGDSSTTYSHQSGEVQSATGLLTVAGQAVSSWNGEGEDTYTATSELTINDVTKPDGTVTVLQVLSNNSGHSTLEDGQSASISAFQSSYHQVTGAISSQSTAASTQTMSGSSGFLSQTSTEQTSVRDTSPDDFLRQRTQFSFTSSGQEAWSQSATADSTTSFSFDPAIVGEPDDGSYQFSLIDHSQFSFSSTGGSGTAFTQSMDVELQSPNGTAGQMQASTQQSFSDSQLMSTTTAMTRDQQLIIDDQFFVVDGEVQSGTTDPVVDLIIDDLSSTLITGTGSSQQSSQTSIVATDVQGLELQQTVRMVDPWQVHTMAAGTAGSAVHESPHVRWIEAEFYSDQFTVYSAITDLDSSSSTQSSFSIEMTESFVRDTDDSSRREQTTDSQFSSATSFSMAETALLEQRTTNALPRLLSDPPHNLSLGYLTTEDRQFLATGSSSIDSNTFVSTITSTELIPPVDPDGEPKLQTTISGQIVNDNDISEQMSYSFSLDQSETAGWLPGNATAATYATEHTREMVQTGSQTTSIAQGTQWWIQSLDEKIDPVDLTGTSTLEQQSVHTFSSTLLDQTEAATNPPAAGPPPGSVPGAPPANAGPPRAITDLVDLTSSGEIRSGFELTAQATAAGFETQSAVTHETDVSMQFEFSSMQSAGTSGTATVGATGSQSIETRFLDERKLFADDTTERATFKSSHIIDSNTFGGVVQLAEVSSSSSPTGGSAFDQLIVDVSFSGASNRNDDQWELVTTDRQENTVTTSGRELITGAGNATSFDIALSGQATSPGVNLTYAFAQSLRTSSGRSDHQIWQNGQETAHYFDEASSEIGSQSMHLELVAGPLQYESGSQANNYEFDRIWSDANSVGRRSGNGDRRSWFTEIRWLGDVISREAGSTSTVESSTLQGTVSTLGDLEWDLVGYTGVATRQGSTLLPTNETFTFAYDTHASLVAPNTVELTHRRYDPQDPAAGGSAPLPSYSFTLPFSGLPPSPFHLTDTQALLALGDAAAQAAANDVTSPQAGMVNVNSDPLVRTVTVENGVSPDLFTSAWDPSAATLLTDFEYRLALDGGFIAAEVPSSEAIDQWRDGSQDRLSSAAWRLAEFDIAGLIDRALPTELLPGLDRLSDPLPSMTPEGLDEVSRFVPVTEVSVSPAVYDLGSLSQPLGPETFGNSHGGPITLTEQPLGSPMSARGNASGPTDGEDPGQHGGHPAGGHQADPNGAQQPGALGPQGQGGNNNGPANNGPASPMTSQQISQEIYTLHNLLMTTLALINSGSLSPTALKNHQDLVIQLRAEIAALMALQGNQPYGSIMTGGDPVAHMSLTQKLLAAMGQTYNSGQLPPAIAAQLQQLLSPSAVGGIALFMGGYFAAHATLAGPALLVFDASLIIYGGSEPALAMWEFYLALENATTQAELDAAAGELTELLSGPMADGLINLLMLGAAKGIPKAAGQKSGWFWHIQETPNGPKPVRIETESSSNPSNPSNAGGGGPSKPPGKPPSKPITPIPGRPTGGGLHISPTMDWQDAYDYFQLGQPFDGPYTNPLNTPPFPSRARQQLQLAQQQQAGPFQRPSQKPSNAPPGTLPINKHPATKDIVHEIKNLLDEDGVGPMSYVGISPNGDLIVTNPDGTAYNLGPWQDYFR
jgi:hypothetical protein